MPPRWLSKGLVIPRTDDRGAPLAAGTQQASVLPRLAIVGDVPVERSTAGALLLYRLFRSYPTDRLMVIQGSESPPERRIPNVSYSVLRTPGSRLLRTRFARFWSLLLMLAAPLRVEAIRRRIRDFQPDAILTVTNGSMWLAASQLGAQSGIPLHLILHDEWPAGFPIPAWATAFQTSHFGTHYRRARSRLCISQGMEEAYAGQYGIGGEVLLPCRGEESPEAVNRVRADDSQAPFVAAYAGSIWVADVLPMLWRLVPLLREVCGPDSGVDVYTPPEQAEGVGASPFHWRGFLPPVQLAEDLGKTASLLVLPVSFAPDQREAVERAFPSKLADYTAIGLPILIWGPESSAAVRWARTFPDAAEVVTEQSDEALREALRRLARSRELRQRLADGGIAAGQESFSLSAARERLFRVLKGLPIEKDHPQDAV